jgi:hypothetical protein
MEDTLFYHTVLNITMLKSKAIMSSMIRNGNEYVNISIIDISMMKNISKRFHSKRKNIIKEKQEKLEKEKIENPAKYLEREKRRLKKLGQSIQ